jgi:hypothetical protein
MVTLLKFNEAEGISSVLRVGDKVSLSSLPELEEACRHIFIPQDSDWSLMLTEREFREVPVGKLKK